MGERWHNVKPVQDDSGHVILSIYGDIGVQSEDVIRDLGDASRVTCLIDSPGGVLRSALAVARALHKKQSLAFIYHRCFSAAVFIALACRSIAMERNAKLMTHRHRWHHPPTPSEIQEMETLEPMLLDWLSSHTGQPARVVEGWWDQQRYFTAGEAQAAGFVQKVFTSATHGLASGRKLPQ